MLVYICTDILKYRWYIILSGNISQDKQVVQWLFSSLIVLFHICKIVNEPWEDAFFSPQQRIFQCSWITFELRASTLLRARTGVGLGLPNSRGSKAVCAGNFKLPRLIMHSATDWLGWALCLGQQTPLELTLFDLTGQIRTNAHWTYGSTA